MVVKTTILYWDCECEVEYIHHKNIQWWIRWNARQEDQPDSHVMEIPYDEEVFSKPVTVTVPAEGLTLLDLHRFAHDCKIEDIVVSSERGNYFYHYVDIANFHFTPEWEVRREFHLMSPHVNEDLAEVIRAR